MITNLKIENFKSISDYSFEFQLLIILVRTNSSGKSSVIQSILFYSYCSNKNIYLEEYLRNFGNIENLLCSEVTKDKEIKITPSINNKKLSSLIFNNTNNDWQDLNNNIFLYLKQSCFIFVQIELDKKI